MPQNAMKDNQDVSMALIKPHQGAALWPYFDGITVVSFLGLGDLAEPQKTRG